MYFGSITGNGVNKNDRYLLKILIAACKKTITKKKMAQVRTTYNQ